MSPTMLIQSIYPTIDIHPVYIQYTVSFILILLLNLILLYQLCLQMFQIYQTDNPSNIVHDIYDKTILHTAIKYIIVNLLCIIYFHDLTTAPVQLMRIFWLYALTIVFMKFDIKDILMPSIYLAVGMIILSFLWIWVYQQLPAFKIIVIQTAVILYYGITQALKITKILSNKSNKHKHSISLDTLLQKNQTNIYEFGQLLPFVELDEHVIPHLQNRRSFCLVFSTVILIDAILLMDLSMGKELLGEVFLSFALDLMPMYIVYWYLKKSERKEKQTGSERISVEEEEFRQQLTARKSSSILIEMVNLKN